MKIDGISFPSGSTNTELGLSGPSIRDYNLQLLAHQVLLSSSPLSRSEIATITGLNKATVTRIIDYLLSMGIVIEKHSRTNGAGRPSIPLAPAPHTHVAIGAEIRSDALEVAVIDLTGTVLMERVHVRDVSKMNPTETATELAEIIDSTIKQIHDAKLSLVGIECGMPGILNEQTGHLEVAHNIGWSETNFCDLLPPKNKNWEHKVHFGNSIFQAAAAETITRERQGTPLANYIYISGFSGVGAAIIRNGQLDTGCHGWAGEIGHTFIAESKNVCSCGTTGCIETFVAKPWIMKAAGLDPQAPLGQLLSHLVRKDKKAHKALNLAGKYLGRAIANYLNLVDVPTVVLGGLFIPLFDYLLPSLEAECNTRYIGSKKTKIDIQSSILTGHASTLGAAWHQIINFISLPQRWQVPSGESLEYVSALETPEIFLFDSE